MKCHLEVEPSTACSHVRVWMEGRPTGVLTLMNAEFEVFVAALQVAFEVTMKKLKPESLWFPEGEQNESET